MIEIQGVSMEFRSKAVGENDKPFQALKDISFTIPDGCVYGFLGSNGAGKSTLMRLMAGVYRLQTGSIRIDGEDVWDNPKAKEKIFFINDETIQYTEFTLEDMRKYYRSYYEAFSDEVFDKLIAQLGLPTDRKLSSFSKGMKRQAVVVLGLACMTKYLILDEAFDGLDPAMRKILKDIIVDQMLDRGSTLILSSHNITEINELCDRALLIHRGELIFNDEIDKIRGGICKVQLMRKDAPVTKQELIDAGLEVMKYSCAGSVAQAVIKGSDEEIMARIGNFNTDIAEMIPLTLEEVFIFELEARGYGYDGLSQD